MSQQNVKTATHESKETSGEEIVSCVMLSESERMDFLPGLFGRSWFRAEGYIYSWMQRHCEGYNGGYWEYYKIGETGGFMAPCFEGEARISISGNWCEVDVTNVAAGVIATLFILNALTWKLHEKDENDPEIEALIEKAEILKDYASTLPERGKIWRAID